MTKPVKVYPPELQHGNYHDGRPRRLPPRFQLTGTIESAAVHMQRGWRPVFARGPMDAEAFAYYGNFRLSTAEGVVFFKTAPIIRYVHADGYATTDRDATSFIRVLPGRTEGKHRRPPLANIVPALAEGLQITIDCRLKYTSTFANTNKPYRVVYFARLVQAEYVPDFQI